MEELLNIKAEDYKTAGNNQQKIFNNLLGDLVAHGSPASVSNREHARRAAKVRAAKVRAAKCLVNSLVQPDRSRRQHEDSP